MTCLGQCAAGDSLSYAFIGFDTDKASEDAYFKMNNVLIDDRRIKVQPCHHLSIALPATFKQMDLTAIDYVINCSPPILNPIRIATMCVSPSNEIGTGGSQHCSMGVQSGSHPIGR